MLDYHAVPDVEQDEIVSRYVLYSRHFRAADGYVKQLAFLPYPHRDTSVTRHRNASDQEVWGVGHAIATQRQRTLYGRSEIKVAAACVGPLRVVAAPLEENPNHADITHWPAEKQEQMALALELASRASLLIPPPETSV